jgi:hypothetical protein
MDNKNKIFSIINLPNSLASHPMDDDPKHLYANQLQVAVINKMMPKGYRLDTMENLRNQRIILTPTRMAPLKRARRVSIRFK